MGDAMTIRDKIRRHESAAEWYERECARHVLKGLPDFARYDAECAAYEHHLAHELEDTNQISIDALVEYVDERKAARGDR